VPSVLDASVNLIIERAGVAYDGAPGTLDAVIAAVGQAGYAGAARETNLEVGGMTCAGTVNLSSME